MASIQVLYEGTKSERYKVMFDLVTGPLDRRKRKSKTFPPGTPMKEIKKFVREVEEQKALGAYVDYSKRTLDDFAKEYFENYGDFISPTTLVNYKRMYYNKLNGIGLYFGPMLLEKVDTPLIQAYVKKLMVQGKSPKTIKNKIMFFHVLLEKAMKLNYIRRGYNPAQGCDLPRLKKKKVEAYTQEEVRKLLHLVNNQENLNLKLLVNLLVGSGIRRGELCSLKYDSFDYEKGIVHITESRIKVDGITYTKAPKTDSGIRDIPIPKSVIMVIRQSMNNYKERKLKYGDKFNDTGYILTTEYGEPMTPDSIYNLYRRFMMRQNEIRYLSLHKLRSTYASIMISNNADIKTVQELLGHSDVLQTLNVYSSAYEKSKYLHSALLEDALFSNDKVAK